MLRESLDAPDRPAEPPKCQNLLSLVVAQDVGHVGERDHSPSAPRQRLERLTSMAGFEVSTYGRIWVSTEVDRRKNVIARTA